MKGNLLTTTEALKRLGVSRQTLYRWRKSGRIKSVRVGWVVMYDTKVISKAVEEKIARETYEISQR